MVALIAASRLLPSAPPRRYPPCAAQIRWVDLTVSWFPRTCTMIPTLDPSSVTFFSAGSPIGLFWSTFTLILHNGPIYAKSEEKWRKT
jgi:hypothetical protein